MITLHIKCDVFNLFGSLCNTEAHMRQMMLHIRRLDIQSRKVSEPGHLHLQLSDLPELGKAPIQILIMKL